MAASSAVNTDFVAGFTHGWHGLDVIPVAVSLEHGAHIEGLAQLQQSLVLVGRVEQHAFSCFAATDHEDVVVNRADDEAVYLNPAIRPVQCHTEIV